MLPSLPWLLPLALGEVPLHLAPRRLCQTARRAWRLVWPVLQRLDHAWPLRQLPPQAACISRRPGFFKLQVLSHTISKAVCISWQHLQARLLCQMQQRAQRGRLLCFQVAWGVLPAAEAQLLNGHAHARAQRDLEVMACTAGGWVTDHKQRGTLVW